MENTIDSLPYPGAHVKYSFSLSGITFMPFSCSISRPEIKEIVFEKAEPENSLNTKYYMTFNFGPIYSLEEALSISESLKEQLLDLLSLEMGNKIDKAELIEHNLTPREGEGGHANLILPALEMEAHLTVEDRKLQDEEVANIQRSLLKDVYANKKNLLTLFRHALILDDILAQFIILYAILDIMTSTNGVSSQIEIDKLIISAEPLTEISKHPTRNRAETCYTRLRNEINHRGVTEPKSVIDEIRGRLYTFRKIVRTAIKKY